MKLNKDNADRFNNKLFQDNGTICGSDVHNIKEKDKSLSPQ